MVSAGLHCSLRISRQILPLLLILGWKTLVLKATYRVHSIIIQMERKIEFSKELDDYHIKISQQYSSRAYFQIYSIPFQTNYS